MPDGNSYIGIRKKAEVDPTKYIRDIRTPSQKFWDGLKSEETAFMSLLVGTVTGLFFPAFADLLFLVLVPYGLLVYRKLHFYELPLRVPMVADVYDLKNVSPADEKPMKGNGIFYIGFDRVTGEPLFLSNSDCRQHMFTLGTTGSGKTEALISKVTNAMNWGSGFIYVDGKADTSLYAKLYSLARRYGRDDDILVCNFMTGNRDTLSAEGNSNTMNPFVAGSSSALTEMITSLMSETSGGDGSMWKQRAQYLIAGLMNYLCYKRDKGELLLDVATVREHLPLHQFLCLTLQAEKDQIDHKIRDQLWAYLESIPEFDKEAVLKQPYVKGYPPKVSAEVHKQHGFLHMQFAKLLGSLADAYGYIFRSQLADIDMYDVVVNRRILVILLPSLEKSPDEIANLGKVLVATLKGMMAATLGSDIEGDTLEIIENRPTNAETPYIVEFDEFGYYASDGMPLMAAQARSLGFCLDFSTQDMNSVLARLDKEAYAVVANTNCLFALKVTDPKETLELVVKTGGEAYVPRAINVNYDGDGIGGYQDSRTAQVEKKDRIEYDDLKAQREGQAHVMFGTNLVRANLFYANPPMCRHIRFNRFIGVESTLVSHIDGDMQSMKELASYLVSEDFKDKRKRIAAPGPDSVVFDKISWLLREAQVNNPIETGVIGLMTMASPEWDQAEEEVNSLPLGGVGQAKADTEEPSFDPDFATNIFDNELPRNGGYVSSDEKPVQPKAEREAALSSNEFADILDRQIVDTSLPASEVISDEALQAIAKPQTDTLNESLLDEIPETTTKSLLGQGAQSATDDIPEIPVEEVDLGDIIPEDSESRQMMGALAEKTQHHSAAPCVSPDEAVSAMSSRPTEVRDAVNTVRQKDPDVVRQSVEYALRRSLEGYASSTKTDQE